MSHLKVAIFFLFLVITFPTSVYSASILLEAPSTEVISDINQEFTVKVKLTIGTSDGTTYYLRGVFYKEGSSQYCGYTWNGNDWFNGPYTSDEGWKKLPSMAIASGSATMNIKSRFDPTSSSCDESGSYQFKVHRYTQAGSATFDDQEPLTINVSFPTFTPSPSKTPSPTKAPPVKPIEKVYTQPSVKQITITATSQRVSFLSPTIPAKVDTNLLSNKSSEAAGVPSVLGEQIDVSPTDEKKQGVLFAVPIMVAGSVCMGAAAYLSARTIKRRRSD